MWSYQCSYWLLKSFKFNRRASPVKALTCWSFNGTCWLHEKQRFPPWSVSWTPRCYCVLWNMTDHKQRAALAAATLWLCRGHVFPPCSPTRFEEKPLQRRRWCSTTKWRHDAARVTWLRRNANCGVVCTVELPQLFYCLELYEVHRWERRKEFRVDLASRWAFPAESGIFQLDGGIFEQIKQFVHKSLDLHLHRRVPLNILWFTVNNF